MAGQEPNILDLLLGTAAAEPHLVQKTIPPTKNALCERCNLGCHTGRELRSSLSAGMLGSRRLDRYAFGSSIFLVFFLLALGPGQIVTLEVFDLALRTDS